MPHKITKTPGLEIRSDASLLASPIALAFVRIAVSRGAAPAEARLRYLNFIRKPSAPSAPGKAAA